MKNFKKYNGITLVSLVVTIVVLLILAGVTINTLYGDNGIITRAKEAVTKNNKMEIREIVEMTLSNIKMNYMSKQTDDKYINYFTYDLLNTELKKSGLKIISDKASIDSNLDDSFLTEKVLDIDDYKVIYISDNKQIYSMELRSDNNSNIILESIDIVGERLSDIITKDNYGDLVNYSVNNVNDWKIFYNDGDNIFLISSYYVLIDSINQDATGISKYNDYVGFWQDESKFRTVGNSDISNTVINKMQFQWGKEFKDNTTYKAKLASTLLNEDNWNNFCDKKYALFACGSPTIELWINAWNQLYPSNMLYTKYYSENGGYYIGKTDDPKSSSNVEMQSSEGYNNKLFYPNTTGENDVYAYWLATPSSYGNKLIMYDGAIYADIYRGTVSGFRPVICLKSYTSGECVKNKNGTMTWILK